MTYWNGSGWEAHRPATPRPKRGGRFLGAATEAGLITLLMFGLIAGTALAAKGGSPGGKGRDSGSLALVVLDGAPAPHHGGRITFNVTTTVDRPFVGLRCWQQETWIYDSYVGYFDDYMFDRTWFVLDSPAWSPSIETSCTARLFSYDKRGRQDVLGTLDFNVAP